jgi:JmjC domain, hydroxylase
MLELPTFRLQSLSNCPVRWRLQIVYSSTFPETVTWTLPAATFASLARLPLALTPTRTTARIIPSLHASPAMPPDRARAPVAAPVLSPTLTEMAALPAYLHRVARPLADEHGAVRVDPPDGWTQPALRLAGASRFFVRVQRLPAMPAPDPGGGDRRFGSKLVFPDSKAPVSLDAYQRRATRFHAYMMDSLFDGQRAAIRRAKNTQRSNEPHRVPASDPAPIVERAELSDHSAETVSGTGRADASGTSGQSHGEDDHDGDNDDNDFVEAEGPAKHVLLAAAREQIGEGNMNVDGVCNRADDVNDELADSVVHVTTEEYEDAFWRALSCGVDGQPIDVPYGVDVEAEGAYDTQGMSYVEWNAAPESERFAISSSRQRTFTESSGTKATGGPTWHVGNINAAGVLRHLPRMPGINHSMFYIGQLFTRFCWHLEDANLNSISFLHEGSAEKIWYIIPPTSSNVFEAYASQEVFAPQMQSNGESGHSLLMSKTILFDPRDVARRGIPVSRIVHKPGSFVYTAPGAYHGGFNCGFNISEAVNFGAPNWLAQGRLASFFAQAVPRSICIPYEYLVFREAVSFVNSLGSDPVAQSLSLTGAEGGEHAMNTHLHNYEQRAVDAKFLAVELRRIIQDGERAIEEFVVATSCLIVEGVPQFDTGACVSEEVEENSHCRDIGLAFGAGAGMHCSICLTASHFYVAVCGSCSDGGEQARCPQHLSVGGLLCCRPGHRPMIIRRHEPVLLLDLLAECERVAGIVVPPNEIIQRYTGYVRHWSTSASLPPCAVPSSGLRLRLSLPESFHEDRAKAAAASTPKRPRRTSSPTRRTPLVSCAFSEEDDDGDDDFIISQEVLDRMKGRKRRRKSYMVSGERGLKKKRKKQPLVET